MNKNKFQTIIIICILICLSLLTSSQGFAKGSKEKISGPQMIIGGKTIKLDVADTEAKRKFGLMGRKSLPKDYGMLFVFDTPTKPVFWMKDCFISLDIIFIKNSRISLIYESVPPCKDIICEQYPSTEYVDYVLEVEGGFAKKHHLKVKDKIILKGFRL